METLTDSVYRLPLINPRQSWIQRELASRAHCSPAHVSRIVGSLVSSGVVSQPYKNRVRLVSPAKLLTLWAARRRMPEPVYASTKLGQEEIERALQGRQGVALTLFRAAWHRTKFVSMVGPLFQEYDWGESVLLRGNDLRGKTPQRG